MIHCCTIAHRMLRAIAVGRGTRMLGHRTTTTHYYSLLLTTTTITWLHVCTWLPCQPCRRRSRGIARPEAESWMGNDANWPLEWRTAWTELAKQPGHACGIAPGTWAMVKTPEKGLYTDYVGALLTGRKILCTVFLLMLTWTPWTEWLNVCTTRAPSSHNGGR